MRRLSALNNPTLVRQGDAEACRHASDKKCLEVEIGHYSVKLNIVSCVHIEK